MKVVCMTRPLGSSTGFKVAFINLVSDEIRVDVDGEREFLIALRDLLCGELSSSSALPASRAASEEVKIGSEVRDDHIHWEMRADEVLLLALKKRLLELFPVKGVLVVGIRHRFPPSDCDPFKSHEHQPA
jgi:hypothetical protein